MTSAFIDNAKVMAKGQITIPKDIRAFLGVSCGEYFHDMAPAVSATAPVPVSS